MDAEDLQQIRNDTLEGMREYLASLLDSGGETGYTGADIGKCGAILDAYLARVRGADDGDDDAVMAAVRDAVVALNELNAACANHLIETDQREHLCTLIIQAAVAAGVGDGHDITEPWREW
jgi:hypothetical protein